MAGEPASGLAYGSLWAAAVLRPFAEQVLAALRTRPGEIVVDLGDDDGTTAALLRRRGLTVVAAGKRPPRPAGALHGLRGAAAVVAVCGGISGSALARAVEAVELIEPRQTLLCSWLRAPHEEAVRRAFGIEPLVAPRPSERIWPDVVRFPGLDHLWAAALARSDVAARAAAMSAAQLAASGRLLRELLAIHLGADASLRIPVAMGVR